MYMVFDEDLIVSIDINSFPKSAVNLQTQIKPKLMYNIERNHNIFEFFISVKKIDKIIIKMNVSNTLTYVVFDGPLTLSNTITVFGHVKTSAFQCLILLLMSHFMRTYNGHFMFTSQHLAILENTNIHQNDHLLFNFPSKKCNKGLCVLLFNADLIYQVNVTIISVKCSNPSNPNCAYAGFVVGETLLSPTIT